MTALFGIVLLAAAVPPLGVLCGFLHADAGMAEAERASAPRHVETSVVPRQEPHQEEQYPARQAPTDLGRAYDPPPGLPWKRPNVAGMQWMTTGYLGARVPLSWPDLQRRLAGERALKVPTAEFDLIVEANWDTGEREALGWRCDVCRGVVADGEKPHDHCRGCGCPCRLPALAGRPPLVGVS